MREGGKILSDIMDEIAAQIFPGQNSLAIDELAERLVFLNGGKPAFKGYGKTNPFPATVCVSLNHEVVHGIPEKKVLFKDGDLVKIDIGMTYKGMITDMARTFAVGSVSSEKKKLMDTTEECLNLGIKELQAGAKLKNYSLAVQKHAEEAGFSVVRDLVGHGVGKKVHEDPYILNYYDKNFSDNELVLEEGMTLALEPMLSVGTSRVELGKNSWVYVTSDGKPSAHFEDTVLITKKGPEILTRN